MSGCSWKKLRRTWDNLPPWPWDGRSNLNVRLLPLQGLKNRNCGVRPNEGKGMQCFELCRAFIYYLF